ncbi:MAG: fumarylacetoacetate hydrolase family protein [Saprospiraceae bacterium]|nr:fumarylacetoacetate hydrolase family protein [Saprospiraceae bacterium]
MKLICIGRNYRDHASELNNPVPTRPLIFMKPPSALLLNNKPFYYPAFTQDLQHEVEVILKISKNGRHIQPAFASGYYQEVGLGIDFTARDVQSELKSKGHPWELAKAFDHSAVVSSFMPLGARDPHALSFHLTKNGEIVQQGNTADLIFDFDYLITYISQFFKLQMGDLIFTGTPAGVGPVQIGDELVGYLEGKEMFTCEIK